MMNLPFLYLPQKTLRLRPPRHPWSQSDRDATAELPEPRGVSRRGDPGNVLWSQNGPKSLGFMGDFRENLQETMVFMGDFNDW